MDLVCASPFAHQFGAVQYMRRSFASGSRWDPPSTGSDCVHSCIVGGSMRLLWGAIAGYSLLCSGRIPRWGRGLMVAHWSKPPPFSILMTAPTSNRQQIHHPVPPFSTLMTAPTSNRRRMTVSAAPERSPTDLDGAILVSKRTCTNYIHPHPHIKVLRSFFKSDRIPVPPSPAFPRS